MKVAVLLAILLIAFCTIYIVETKGSNHYGGTSGWRRQPSDRNVWRDIFGTRKKPQDDDDDDDDSIIDSPARPPPPEIIPDSGVDKLVDGMRKYQEERETYRLQESHQQRDEEKARLSAARQSIGQDIFDPDFAKKHAHRILG